MTLAANQCNAVPRLLPSKWRFQNFEACDLQAAALKEPIGFWTIYYAVGLEAFLWGLGTAIGELPPYFVARAASIAGTTNEELTELLEENTTGFVGKLKQTLFKFLKRNAFIAVTIAASVSTPKPLTLLFPDTESAVRRCGTDVWPLADPVLGVFLLYINRESDKQSVAADLLHHFCVF